MSAPTPVAARRIALGAARFQALHGLWGMSMALLGAGLVLNAAGADRAAVRMFAAEESMRESAGVATMPYAVVWVDSALEQLQARTPVEAFAAEWAAGQAYTVDEAMVAAQAELAALAEPRRGRPRTG